MKEILLLCSEGMSTSMIVQRMQEEAKKQGKEYYIHADSMKREDKLVPNANVVLMGPQVRYALKQLQQKYPDKKIVDIPMMMYGTFDGKKILAYAEENMG